MYQLRTSSVNELKWSFLRLSAYSVLYRSRKVLSIKQRRVWVMTQQEKLQAGNNIIEAVGDFADGYINGSLYYYDTNHQLPRPFTSQVIYAFMEENLYDRRATAEWNAGFVFGWIAAFCENNPAFFFTSITIPESVTVTAALPVITLQ